jgi:hypothetical protein
MAYLIHFNQNHSSKDGRFVSGDGDGDGIVNDHSSKKENKENGKHMSRDKARRIRNSGIALCVSAAGLQIANTATYTSIGNDWVHNVAAGIAGAGLVVGATQIVRGAVSMGKASRRGDHS